jgi:DNA-binding NarL/FixJ family response regulator
MFISPQVFNDREAIEGLIPLLVRHMPQPDGVKPDPLESLPWKLTPRERAVCRALADLDSMRHDNKYIADKLGLTAGTIKVYLSRLSQRTGLDRIGLAFLGFVVNYHESRLMAELPAETRQ